MGRFRPRSIHGLIAFITAAIAVALASPAAAQKSVPLPEHLKERYLSQLLPADGVVRGPVQYPQMGRYRLHRGFAAPHRGSPRPIARIETPQAAVAARPARSRSFDPAYLPKLVTIHTSHPRGTIIIDTETRYLYQVRGNGQAMRYGVGVGKTGFSWRGTEHVSRKKQWPSWSPPATMIRREAAKGRNLPRHMKGGPANPLGARALYLGSTLYRIHGTNQPWTIGRAVSSGCIRMRNEDVIELYRTTPVGALVVVR